MKQLFFLFIAFLLPLFSYADDSGTCGDGLTYTYVESTQTLTITGNGAMSGYDYYSPKAPWSAYKADIKTIIIAEGVTSIGRCAFYGCSGLTSITISNSVKNIGNYAFQDCSGLTAITIPSNVTSIEDNAFYRCGGLTTITVADGNTKYDSRDNCNAIIETATNELVRGCQNTAIPNSVTSIGDKAFELCSGLTSVTIPNSVSSIGEGAFADCRGLTSITIPNNVTSIGDEAFYGCTGLTSIILPNSLTCIEDDVFGNCSGLTSITIPESVTSIGTLAFQGCTGLTSVTIPESVTSIGGSAFNGCSSLTSITIPEGVTSIEEGVFWGCSGLTSITLPNSVTSIGDAAFVSCSSLISIAIPEGVTSIGESAFNSCSSLTSITLPEGVTNINNMTFYRCSGLTSIVIPNSITSIGSDVFYECSNLTRAEFGSIESLCRIKYIALNSNPLYYAKHLYINGSKVTNVTIPESVTSICNYAFAGCSDLMSVSIPNSVTTIGYQAFYQCSGLTSIAIPNSVTTIGNQAFYQCSGLTTVTIGNGLTTISESVFEKCSGMETLKLPDNLQIIKKAAFKGCNSLKEVSIPSSVEFIYQEAFANCNALESIKAQPNTPPFLYDNSFSNFSVPLRVPKGCKEAYQSAQGWKNFTTIIDADKYKLTYVVDGEEYKNYEIDYGTTITPEATPMKEGYTFSGWSEIPATMPAHDVIVTGSFTINKYKFIYQVDGEVYKSYELDYGTNITPETVPTKEGYTFSGWSEIPETMPAHDVTVTGTFSINSYKLTYMIDDNVYKETVYEYGAPITPEPQPEGDYTAFKWIDVPQTMPAHNVVVYASYIIELTIIDAEQGRTKLRCEAGKSYTLQFEPSDRWHIHSVTYCGTDVTDLLTEDNVFTTPAITQNAELYITYSDVATRVKSVTPQSNFRVLVKEQSIVVQGAEVGTPIQVFDLNGRQITSTKAGDGETRVNVNTNEHVLLIKVGDQVVKVAR